MSNFKYTKDHEWLALEKSLSAGMAAPSETPYVVVMGITDYAQQQLGELVYIELPESGSRVEAGEDLVILESSKSAGEICAPLSGKILAVNDELSNAPQTVNTDPTGAGWILKIGMTDLTEFDELMDQNAYEALLELQG